MLWVKVKFDRLKFGVMRLCIELEPINDAVIDLNYSYYIASLIYRSIQRADPSLSLDLHKPNTFKFFTFSKLMVPKRRFKIEGNKMIIESKSVYFYFSTILNHLGVCFVEGLLNKPEVNIGGVDFVVSGIRVIKEREIGSKARFVTLSPISVTTVKDGRTVDLYPDDPKFYDNLRKNLIKKYIALYGKEPPDCKLKIEVLKVKPKRIKVKNTFHRCVEMVFDAEGSKELLEIGYKAGFGERNSMGFGMVKVV